MIPEAPETEEETVFYAPHLKRLLAFIIDVILLSILLSFGIGYLLDDDSLANTQDEWIQQAQQLQSSPTFFWMMIGAFTLYFGGFQASAWQATPGKRLMGLYVTDLQGQRLGWLHSLWRAAIETANFVILGGLPAILALFHPHGQTAHDVIAKTYVLSK